MGRKPKDTHAKRPIPSVQRAFLILEYVCSTRRGRTISEIARTFRIPVSTCSGVLYTLVGCGYLTRDENGVFSLTTKMLSHASKALNFMELNDIGQGELDRLTAVTGLASALFKREGNSVVCIAKVEGTSHVRTAAHVGKQMPMHATCSGKSLLAYLSEEEVDVILETAGLPKLTENTITSVPLLKEELARVRSLGYAVDDQEYGVGVRGIGAPVFDGKGRVIGSITASAAAFELDRDTAHIVAAVKVASLEVSKVLGYSESVVSNVYPRSPGDAPPAHPASEDDRT